MLTSPHISFTFNFLFCYVFSYFFRLSSLSNNHSFSYLNGSLSFLKCLYRIFLFKCGYYLIICLVILNCLPFSNIFVCLICDKMNEKLEIFFSYCGVKSTTDLLLLDYILLAIPFVYFWVKLLHFTFLDPQYYMNIWLEEYLDQMFGKKSNKKSK